LINKVIKFDKKGKDKIAKLFNVISDVRENHYDIVICPHRFLSSGLITYFSKAPVRIGFGENALSFLLTNKVRYDKSAHEIQRNLDLISEVPELELDDSKISEKPELYPGEKDTKIVDTLLKNEASDNLIAFAPCSKWFTKQLTKEKSLEIINELFVKNYKVVLLGGAEDFEYCKALEKQIGNNLLITLCGRLTPVQSSIAINKAKVLITVDSAAQHLGAATDTPIVLI